MWCLVQKKSITCGLVQKSHQHVVLPAISSDVVLLMSRVLDLYRLQPK
jgi:hypothetical protein